MFEGKPSKNNALHWSMLLQQCLPQLLFLCITIDLEMTNKGFIVYIIDRMTLLADSVFEIFLCFQKSLESFLFEFSRQKRPKLHSFLNHITLQLFDFPARNWLLCILKNIHIFSSNLCDILSNYYYCYDYPLKMNYDFAPWKIPAFELLFFIYAPHLGRTASWGEAIHCIIIHDSMWKLNLTV